MPSKSVSFSHIEKSAVKGSKNIGRVTRSTKNRIRSVFLATEYDIVWIASLGLMKRDKDRLMAT